jgi:predicted Zn-dependent protease
MVQKSSVVFLYAVEMHKTFRKIVDLEKTLVSSENNGNDVDE